MYLAKSSAKILDMDYVNPAIGEDGKEEEIIMVRMVIQINGSDRIHTIISGIMNINGVENIERI